jgi:MFS transporter, DHA1 family, multidrug resistance protein
VDAAVAEVTPPDWRRNQAAVTAAAFVGFTGFTLVMPFLPLYFEQLGVHDLSRVAIWSGVSLGVTPAVTAVMSPFWARVGDRYGRKLMVGRSLASFVVIMALMAYVDAPWQVFALRALQGLFAGYGTIAMTMAAESAPPEQVAAAIGWVQTAQRLGPALGPVIGGALAQAFGLRPAFLVSAGFYLCAFLLIVFGYRERTTARSRETLPQVSFAQLRRVPNFLLFMSAIFGLQLVDRSFGPVLPLYLREIGVEPGRVPFLSGVIFTTMAAAAAIGNQASGWLLRRSPPARLIPAMATIAAVASLVYGVVAPIGVLLATAVVFGLGLGIATTSVYATASTRVSVAERGVAFGYLSTAYLAGLAVSPVVAGLIGSVSMRGVFAADAIGLAVLAVVVGRKMTAIPGERSGE